MISSRTSKQSLNDTLIGTDSPQVLLSLHRENMKNLQLQSRLTEVKNMLMHISKVILEGEKAVRSRQCLRKIIEREDSSLAVPGAADLKDTLSTQSEQPQNQPRILFRRNAQQDTRTGSSSLVLNEDALKELPEIIPSAQRLNMAHSRSIEAEINKLYRTSAELRDALNQELNVPLPSSRFDIEDEMDSQEAIHELQARRKEDKELRTPVSSPRKCKK